MTNQPETLIERICAAIRAADNKSVDGDCYMLDSNDCIKIIETFANHTAQTTGSAPVVDLDVCTESNCHRCNTPKAWRTAKMFHAGIGSYPDSSASLAASVMTDRKPAGIASAMPGADAWTIVVCKAEDVPVGTALYTKSVTSIE